MPSRERSRIATPIITTVMHHPNHQAPELSAQARSRDLSATETPRARGCRLPLSIVEVNAWLAGRATTPAPRLPDDASTLVNGSMTRSSLRPRSPVRVPQEIWAPRGSTRSRSRAARGPRGALGMLPFALGQLAGLDLWAQGFDDQDPRCRGAQAWRRDRERERRARPQSRTRPCSARHGGESWHGADRSRPRALNGRMPR